MYLPPACQAGRTTRYSIPSFLHYLSFPSTDSTVSFGTCSAYDPPSSKYNVDDILQIILKTRKNWKTLKGQSEAVWPPYLEATMLEALQQYEPADSRETRMLGRHPMRNRFISEYIHSATGKHRSAKQVGSRLQQLRDTPEGRELIDVLTRCHRIRMGTGSCDARLPECQPASWVDPSSSPSISSISWDSSSPLSSGSPIVPTNTVMPRFPQPKPRQPIESRMPVYIDILPQQSLWQSTATSSSGARPSDAPRHIVNIDPTVTFVSPCPVNGRSSYIVLLDGAPVHTEHTTLKYVGPYFPGSSGQAPNNEPALYNTELIPKYWSVLCEAPDPTLYTIIQDVDCLPTPASNQDHTQRPRPVRIFSAVYHFQYSVTDTGPTSSYGQSATDVSSSGPPTTSTFGQRALQGSIPPGVASASSLSASQVYTTPQGSQFPTELEQNLLDAPFMLDVNFDQLVFDDLVVNMDGTHQGPNTYYM